jgi:hypothetical protein
MDTNKHEFAFVSLAQWRALSLSGFSLRNRGERKMRNSERSFSVRVLCVHPWLKNEF